jgi:hypothetical protein
MKWNKCTMYRETVKRVSSPKGKNLGVNVRILFNCAFDISADRLWHKKWIQWGVMARFVKGLINKRKLFGEYRLSQEVVSLPLLRKQYSNRLFNLKRMGTRNRVRGLGLDSTGSGQGP